MTKEEMMNKIKGVPDDILEIAYALNLLNLDQIQMKFNTEILKKYNSQIVELHIDVANGYLKFTINGQKICMT